MGKLFFLDDLTALPILNSKLMSPMECELSEFFWDYSKLIVEKWISSQNIKVIESDPLSDDYLVIYMVTLEVRNLALSLIAEERMTKVLSNRKVKRALEQLNNSRFFEKLVDLNLSSFFIDDIQKEVDWLNEIQKHRKTLEYAVEVEGWFCTYELETSKFIGRKKTICFWYIKRIEKFLNYCGYKLSFEFVCSILNVLGDSENEISNDVMESAFDGILDIKFSKSNFSSQHFSMDVLNESVAEDRTKLVSNLKKCGFRARNMVSHLENSAVVASLDVNGEYGNIKDNDLKLKSVRELMKFRSLEKLTNLTNSKN